MGEQRKDETGNLKNVAWRGSNPGPLEEQHSRCQLSYSYVRVSSVVRFPVVNGQLEPHSGRQLEPHIFEYSYMNTNTVPLCYFEYEYDCL